MVAGVEESHSRRVGSLDGLRGVAALIVVLHHAFLVVPALSLAYDAADGHVSRGSAAWWLTYSPLHLVWAGGEAVLLFFVLSGYVLALPLVAGGQFSWLRYYPRRLLRLYGPTIAAVVFAVIAVSAMTRVPQTGMSGWLRNRPTVVSPSMVGHDLFLVDEPGQLLAVLWSLQWEVVFSLALPAFILLGRLGRRHPGIVLGTLVAVVFGSEIWSPVASVAHGQATRAMLYLPMFAIGVVLAFHQPAIRSGCDWVRARRGGAGLAATVVVLLISSRWLVLAFRPPEPSQDVRGLGMAMATVAIVVAGALLVAMAVGLPGFRAFLERRPIRWLGVRSFSLYLVHEPIIVTLGYASGAGVNGLAFLVVVLPAVLVATALFHRAVEVPLMAIIQARFGRNVSQSQASGRSGTSVDVPDAAAVSR